MAYTINFPSRPLGDFSIYACLAVVLFLAARQVHLWYRLRHIPGPTSAGWSLWWQLRSSLGGEYNERLKEAAEKYVPDKGVPKGPLVRIGPSQLLSSDPEVIRQISSVRSSFTKGRFYESGRIVPGVDNVVSTRNEDKHKAMRAQMAPAFHPKEQENYSFEAGIDRQLTALIRLLDEKYISTGTSVKPFDLAEKTQFFALDAIGDISWGKPFGYLETDQDLYDYNAINMSSLPIMDLIAVFPWLGKVAHAWPMRLVLPSEGDKVGFGRLMGFVRGFVEKRVNSEPGSISDMLQIHINNGMTTDDLIQQSLISIIAGSNSTAHALRMTLLSLITAPLQHKALMEEIHQSSFTVDSPITWVQTQQLPYLQAVVREGLRMWPPIAGLGFKRVPPGGKIINGYFVPEGTEIGQGFLALGRSKSVWGDDADVFRPERWLTADGEELKRMTSAVDTHFGFGKYACMGKPIAMMELHKAVYELTKHYDFSLMNPQKPIKTHASIFLFASDFWVTITKRDL